MKKLVIEDFKISEELLDLTVYAGECGDIGWLVNDIADRFNSLIDKYYGTHDKRYLCAFNQILSTIQKVEPLKISGE